MKTDKVTPILASPVSNMVTSAAFSRRLIDREHLDRNNNVVLAGRAIHTAGHQAGEMLLKEQVQMVLHHGLRSACTVLQHSMQVGTELPCSTAL